MKAPWWLASTLLLSRAALGEGPAPACAAGAEGSACTFTSQSRPIAGTCHVGPDQQASTCLPAPNDAALSACAAKAEGEACTFGDADVTLKGSCAKAGISLACTPSKPSENYGHGLLSTNGDMPAPQNTTERVANKVPAPVPGSI
jgi:hypothetical protein